MENKKETIEYKVMMLDRRNESTKFLFEKMDEQLQIYENAYALEMSLLNGEPKQTFKVDDNQICIAFTKEYEVLGFSTVEFNPVSKYLFIEHIYVKPNLRKKGVFKSMYARIEKMANDIGADKICSFVFRSNIDSKKAHAKLGFSKRLIGFVKELCNDRK